LTGHKKVKFLLNLFPWEIDCGFNPPAVELRSIHKWVDYRGETPSASTCQVTAEDVASGDKFDFGSLNFRNPEHFIAGNLHNFVNQWVNINPTSEVLNWIKEGVKIEQFFKPFKGNFKGVSYKTSTPPAAYFPNASNCEKFVPFIVETLTERIKNGSISVIGKVGECDPPHLVLPITIEPSKPRLCHDERFLNLWIKDSPFQLDTLKEIPRIIEKNSLMTSLDDKSGYDHILLHPNSRKYFGLQFGSWYMVFNVITFGFKASAYIYQSVGLVPVSYCRSLGVPCLLYIDDRLLAELKGHFKDSALRSLFIVCQVLIRLGYFLNLKKCVLSPTTTLRFLGMLVNSEELAFIVPEDKKMKFIEIREVILAEHHIDLKTLQRFAGKCISLILAIPSAKLFTKEVNRAISTTSKNSRPVKLVGELRQEIEHWRFLDTWSGCAPWRSEKHLQITLASDSSLYKWGAVVLGADSSEEFSDLWEKDDDRPIHIKESHALLNALVSKREAIAHHRVDVYVDNLPLVQSWEGYKGKDVNMMRILKRIFELSQELNFHLSLLYIPSGLNPADPCSRTLSVLDAKLCQDKWEILQGKFGPHSVDLMALDSNAMLDYTGLPLRHFTPFPSPDSHGVNVFAQDISKEIAPYVFPPFALILPLLKLLSEQKVKFCTMVVPKLHSCPVWWPIFQAKVSDWFTLAKKGDYDAILYPSKTGYSPQKFGLSWDLIAAKLKF